ncbi:MAG: hypothetical protein ABIP94_02715 [Planctomycetota bacterium]
MQAVREQQRHDFAPFAQRRHVQADHVQSPQQFGPERPGFGPRRQVAVARRQHAHVDAHGLLPAERHELAFLQETFELRLHGWAHVGDLVEEQGAPVSPIQQPRAPCACPREGAGLAAEEFALDQRVGHGGAVHGHERLVAPWRTEVQGLGHEPLAGARFAGQQHGRRRVAQQVELRQQLLHRRALTHEAGLATPPIEHGPQVAVLARGAAQLHGALEAQLQFFERERFGDEIRGAQAHGLDGGRDRAVRGHQHDDGVGIGRTHAGERGQAVGAGHLEVDDGEVEWPLLPARDRFVAVVHGIDGVAGNARRERR